MTVNEMLQAAAGFLLIKELLSLGGCISTKTI